MKKELIWGIIVTFFLIISYFSLPIPFVYDGKATIHDMLIGPKIDLQLQYPPINENEVRVLYQNEGGIPFKKIYIRYDLLPNENIDINPKNYVASLEDINLDKGEKATFYLNISSMKYQGDCKLLKKDPEVEYYQDLINKKCYFYLKEEIPANFCVASLFTFHILTDKGEFNLQKYYPLSFNSTEVYMWGWDGEIPCENIPFKLIPNETLKKSDISLDGFTKLNVDKEFKLAKRLCIERELPQTWCLDNI